VFEPGFMKLSPESVKVFQAFEDQATASDVVHPRELHLRISVELVEYCAFALMALRNGYACASSSSTENGLEGIKHASVRGAPLLDNLEIFCGRCSLSDVIPSAVNPRLRPSWEH
jgi:hypothetical protein